MANNHFLRWDIRWLYLAAFSHELKAWSLAGLMEFMYSPQIEHELFGGGSHIGLARRVNS
jgi:hypothetical protein